MCGISGVFSYKNEAEQLKSAVESSIFTLKKRGPEVQQVSVIGNAVLGHARLAILDTSNAGNQPFTDDSNRYTIVYNGEFYNYRDFYKELEDDGVKFRSTSDTEVLLHLYIKYGSACIHKINGFFAFAIYDAVENSLFVARDRIGIKPLYVINNERFFGFSSELKGIMAFPFERKLNYTALSYYLQLNYVPAPLSMVEGVEKVEPGTMLKITKQGIQKERYYQIPNGKNTSINASYEDAQTILIQKLTESVRLRLISDVPLGTFLSGGIDSSIISLIASRYVDSLQTFSIGFKDNPFIDETYYAQLVAKEIHSQHTEIQIDKTNLEYALESILSDIDEPFADSSAIAVNVLCKFVKPHVTVALSGDGADELFAGYHKHFAHYNHMRLKNINSCLAALHPLVKILPQSRSNGVFNFFRKISKYSEIASYGNTEAYWRLCSIGDEKYVANILHKSYTLDNQIKEKYTNHFSQSSDINDVLYADQQLVLPNDMLTKVDRMSMENSLEVRTPFLDYTFVEFVNFLPPEYKINAGMKKRILQDAFRDDLPDELYNRPKKGFEVPLQHWCSTIFPDLEATLLSPEFIEQQGIFNSNTIDQLKKQSTSSTPNDAPAQIWALLVFQSWWKRYF